MSDNINILTAEAVELLKEMIAIPSPSFHEEDVCSHISNWLTQKGVEHERIGNNIIAEHIVNPEEPTLMLCAHIDTVDPCEGYSFDPYKPENSPEGVIQGLGSNDDGASVVSMIAAYRYWRLGNFQNNPSHAIGAGPSPCGQGGSTVLKTTHTPINLTLVLTCEEERSGKGGMTGLWDKRLNRIDFAIVGEPTKMMAATSERGLLVIDATAHGVSGHAARNEGKNALYLTAGNIYENGPVLAYLDVLYARQGLDSHGIITELQGSNVPMPVTAQNTEYFTLIGNVDYRIHPHWNVYVKGVYETARVYKSNGTFEKGLYKSSWNAQACVEYFPMKNSELLIFAHLLYKGYNLTNRAQALGGISPDKQRLSIGLVYSIPVF